MISGNVLLREVGMKKILVGLACGALAAVPALATGAVDVNGFKMRATSCIEGAGCIVEKVMWGMLWKGYYKFSNKESVTLYAFDEVTFKQSPHFYTMMISAKGKELTPNVRTLLTYNQVRCSDFMMRSMKVTAFSGYFGEGDVVLEFDPERGWEKPMPHQDFHAFTEIACRRYAKLK